MFRQHDHLPYAKQTSPCPRLPRIEITQKARHWDKLTEGTNLYFPRRDSYHIELSPSKPQNKISINNHASLFNHSQSKLPPILPSLFKPCPFLEIKSLSKPK